MPTSPAEDSCTIIALDKFIQATRDSGYKGTASAISELIDNSIQAGATRIDITFTEIGGEFPVEVSILDNGSGMDPFTLRQALRFGGSSRFGDRSGLGRYGMGLPNSSLSQARHMAVFTWQPEDRPTRPARDDRPRVFTSYLDVDEIARGELEHVPIPRLASPPPELCAGRSGTLILWQRCDRLDARRVSTLVRKVSAELGRRFRHFLWEGLKLTINGELVEAVDPLFLRMRTSHAPAELFGEEITYEVMVDPNDEARGTGYVTVRFSELPVFEWQKLSNEDKRELGVSKGAGVSIVRAGREVDYGWFFMGSKRRENYDDWWRCEVQFDPVLDEAFGITHTKQQIHPQAHLLEALTPDLESTARALNSRARKAHLETKAQEDYADVERIATERSRVLAPLPAKPARQERTLMEELKKQHPKLRAENPTTQYAVVEDDLHDTSFFSYARDGERIVVALNTKHAFYKRLYQPLAESDAPRDKELRGVIDLLLLAAARSEAAANPSARDTVSDFKREWSDVLATFLRG